MIQKAMKRNSKHFGFSRDKVSSNVLRTVESGIIPKLGGTTDLFIVRPKQMFYPA